MTGNEKKTVFEKLRKVQLDLKAPKSQYNKFGNFYYRNCEDVLEAVKPLLDEAELTLVLSDELINIGDRYYVQATASVTDGENEVSATAYAREEETKKGMDAAQVTGAASSYARKYALNGLFNIDDTKDADSQDNTNQESKKPTRKPQSSELATEKQRQLIQQKLADQGISQENTKGYLIERFGVELPLTKEGASFVIEELIGGQQ